MMYQIIITTEKNRTYRENWYNLIEASNRLLEVMQCENVGMVDLMCLTTGEILVTVIDTVIEYVATEYIERFYEEIQKRGVDKTPFIMYNKSIEREVNKMRKISPEEREMLIVAENFGCVAEVIAELGITAEEAKEIIWGEDQERVEKPFFYLGILAARGRLWRAGLSRIKVVQQKSVENALYCVKVLNPESALYCVKAQKYCAKIKT